jgi:hypothetical protein
MCTFAPAVSNIKKISDENSGCLCLIIKLPAKVPIYRLIKHIKINI